MSEKIEYIEIDLNLCVNEYGVAPCTAEVGVTGDEKCFNCRATCQDLANYKGSEKGKVSYPNVTNYMPSPFDPSGWFGATSDPDGTIANINTPNPSGSEVVGLLEQVGTSFNTFSSSSSFSVNRGEQIYSSLIAKNANSLAVVEYFFDFSVTDNGQYRVRVSDGKEVFSGSDEYINYMALSDGYVLIQSVRESSYDQDVGLRNSFFEENDSTTKIPDIGSNVYVQAVFAGKNPNPYPYALYNEWASTDELSEWGFNNISESISNGILSIGAINADPSMSRGPSNGFAEFDGSLFNMVEIRFKQFSGGSSLLLFRNIGGGGYSSNDIVAFGIGYSADVELRSTLVGPDGSGFYTAFIDMSNTTGWSDSAITHIRLDMFGNDSNAHGEIDYIKIYSPELKATYDSWWPAVYEPSTVRYAVPTSRLPLSIDAIPSIQGIQFDPAALELGKGLGVRASLSVAFKDHRSPDNEVGGDRYPESRAYNPYDTGSYWGKFRSRFPYLKNQPLRWIKGNISDSMDAMETRHYVIEDFAGPDNAGNFKIVAKDILKLADGDRALAPKVSNGYLQSDIGNSTTSIALLPASVGSEYPSSGKVCIGGTEIANFTRSGDNMTIVRAQDNTPAEEHKADAKVQLVLEYDGENPADIWSDLLSNYADVPSEYIPLSAWTVESDTYINNLYSAIIPEPTPVKELLNELLTQTATTMYWSDESQLINVSVLKRVPTDAVLFDDDIIEQDSLNIKDQPQSRVSQVWTYYGQLNPTLKLDEVQNYSNILATTNTDSEEFYGSPMVKQIFSRWIPAQAQSVASNLNNLILQRFVDPPRRLGFRLFRNDQLQIPQLVSGYKVESWPIQKPNGELDSIDAQIVRVKPNIDYIDVVAEEVRYSELIPDVDPDVIDLVIDTNSVSVNIYDLASQIKTVTSDTTVNVTINSGVVVGGSSNSYGLRIGGFPSGAIVNITNNGTISGRAGRGGNGGAFTVDSIGQTSGFPVYTQVLPQDGWDGGDALLIDYDVNFINNGNIYRGGGGGGGGGGAFAFSRYNNIVYLSIANGAGGGAGTGSLPGIGGASISYNFPSGGYYSTESATSQPGGGSSFSSRGAGGSGATAIITYVVPQPPGEPAFPTVVSAMGGDGGDGASLSSIGQSGSGGESTSIFEQSGASRGDNGRAIVETSGTISLTNNGTIIGAIL